jgi:tRNA (adenine22-N1)-methyltransferase
LTEKTILSARLRAVADQIRCSERVADIGCDHAYVPIALIREGRIRSAIAADVRPGPLAIARAHIDEEGLSDVIETRLSDGFEAIRPGEADGAILAGMGGMLICTLLEQAGDVLPALKELVLEPQSDADKVRALLSGGVCGTPFVITDEQMICEGGIFYPVIRAVPGRKGQSLSREELMYGPVLLERRDPVLYRYLQKQKRVLEAIAEKLPNEQDTNARTRERVRVLCEERACLQRALERYADSAAGEEGNGKEIVR